MAAGRSRSYAAWTGLALIAVALAIFWKPAGQGVGGTINQPAVLARGDVPAGAGFDFYVLSLSWSPSYCEAEGEDANRQQCASARPYAFVVHGLWPQFERGYPENCRTDEEGVDNATLRTLYDIMPSAGLIRHQWRKHGSCAGLSQDDYFDVLRAAREAVAIPAEFRRLDAHRTLDPDDAERAFLAANPALTGEGVAVTCDRRFLREVRICLTKDLAFRECPEVD
ncbi:ribonuclease T2 family protein, partial [Allomesorhizobium alhagi]